MSTLRTVPESEWRGFFDRVSNALLGTWAEIEVASLDIGDQIAGSQADVLFRAGSTRQSAVPAPPRVRWIRN
jgi:hypothetical protein